MGGCCPKRRKKLLYVQAVSLFVYIRRTFNLFAVYSHLQNKGGSGVNIPGKKEENNVFESKKSCLLLSTVDTFMLVLQVKREKRFRQINLTQKTKFSIMHKLSRVLKPV